MTTDFFSAPTQHHPMHEAETLARVELDVTPTAPVRREPASTAGWLVSGLAALIGITTFSIVGAYALDEFTQPPPSPRTSQTSPDVVIHVPQAPPAPTTTPEVVKPAEPSHVVVVPSPRTAPPTHVSVAPATSPVQAPVPPTTTAPPPPPSSWHHPSLCHLVKCPTHHHSADDDDTEDTTPTN
jgi:hypothetical protein